MPSSCLQGLFDVHPSYHNSTLESFVSHGSGAPGLDIVVDKYHAMVSLVDNRALSIIQW